MQEIGTFNPSFRADRFGLKNLGSVAYNLEAPRLYEEAIRRGEAKIAAGGPLVAETGQHTGRSPKDKFIIRDALTDDTVWWDNSNAMSPAHFDVLHADMLAHAEGLDLFAQDLYGGADPAYRVKVRVFTEYAWHSLFIRTLLIRPPVADLASFTADMTIIDLPSFKGDPARHGCRTETVVAVNFTKKIVLIGGTSYAGEMKKSVFGYLNFVLPGQGIMPMHCSANTGPTGDSALFFGLSGTGKTTLSADASRTLVGDDEHGWGKHGIFNFEGGCYAKAIKLSREAEPEIYATAERFGSVMENVVLDPLTQKPDFDDGSKTENTRIAYPLDYIPNASTSGLAGHPKNILMLTCDAFGVLPPIAKLDGSQAMYHFLSGYTAKVAGTEKGVTEPQATFSTCFGAPFMPPPPDRLRQHAARPDRQAFRRLLARQHGLDGRQIRRRPPHADPRDAPAARRRARRIAGARDLPHRPLFRPRRAGIGARRRAASALSGQDLGLEGRVRGERAEAHRHVPRELRQVRAACRRGGARRAAVDPPRRGIESHAALTRRLSTGGAASVLSRGERRHGRGRAWRTERAAACRR